MLLQVWAQQQQEGGGSLELAGLPGDHHCPMVKHRARFIHYCHCSRCMGGMLAFFRLHTAYDNQVMKVDCWDFRSHIVILFSLCSIRRSQLRADYQLQWHLMTARCMFWRQSNLWKNESVAWDAAIQSGFRRSVGTQGSLREGNEISLMIRDKNVMQK